MYIFKKCNEVLAAMQEDDKAEITQQKDGQAAEGDKELDTEQKGGELVSVRKIGTTN